MQPPTALRSRLDTLLPAALLVGGSIAFLGGGSRHPQIGSALGPAGSDAFFEAFAHKILHVPHWETMHALILAGPVLWALGAAGAARLVPTRVAALGEVARASLLLAAAAWALAFILDGFVAPVLARPIAAAASPAELHAAITPFRANQLTMARLGMISMVLIGGAASAFAITLLASARRSGWGAIVGATGLAVGVWPIVAAATGEFAPGPFTSPYWRLTALATGAWFALLATALPGNAAVAGQGHLPAIGAPEVGGPESQHAPSAA
jgi:hypothetical protein